MGLLDEYWRHINFLIRQRFKYLKYESIELLDYQYALGYNSLIIRSNRKVFQMLCFKFLAVNIRSYYIKFNLFILLSSYSFVVKSQDGTITYKRIINDKILKENREQKLTIYFNNSSSIELINKPKIAVTDNSSDELNQIKVFNNTKPYFVFKDFSKKKLLFSDYIGSTKQLVTDTLNNFKWNVKNERQKIGSFNCKKATTSFRGRFYEAWYTEDVPLRNGPWKFCGLPGLIIKIKDSNSDFIYELTGINLKEKFDDKLISIPSKFVNDKVITYKEFRSLYKKKLDANIKLSRVNQVTPDGITGTVKITLPEKQEKF